MALAAGSQAEAARQRWCEAVNAHRGWGRWGHVRIEDSSRARSTLAAGLRALFETHL
jgi:hypothetical protein